MTNESWGFDTRNTYTRIMNPTQPVFEARVSSLEGAPDTALASRR
jgi:O-acetylhomoserine/O-acetylserine sulfhydrylase-like pyridoxal-dependent enzyme